MDSVKDLGQRLTQSTGDLKETCYLFQRLSVCVDAVAFRGTFEQQAVVADTHCNSSDIVSLPEGTELLGVLR